MRHSIRLGQWTLTSVFGILTHWVFRLDLKMIPMRFTLPLTLSNISAIEFPITLTIQLPADLQGFDPSTFKFMTYNRTE